MTTSGHIEFRTLDDIHKGRDTLVARKLAHE